MEKIKKALPFALVLILNFYLLPLLIKDTGPAILMLMGITPIVTIILSLLYSYKNGVDPIMPIFCAVLFAPTIFIYYNMSAWPYMIVYAVLSLMGEGMGRLFASIRSMKDKF